MKAMNWFHTCFVVAVLVMLQVFSTPSTTVAQNYAGIRGVVTDPSGAVVPNATVQVKGEKKGLTYSTTTNQLGEYELPALLPDTYTMTVSVSGFTTFENTGIIVYTRDTRRVDVKLALGAEHETVTVSEEGAVIQTDSATIRERLSQREVYGTNQQASLINVLANNPGSEVRSQVHGNYANNTTAEQDGFATNAYMDFRGPQELVSEITQISVNAPAEYRTSTSVIGVGKGGSNRPHIEFFGHFTHPNLTVRTVGATVPRPPAHGAIAFTTDVSGPVYIPKVYDGRNKTFFSFLDSGSQTVVVAPYLNYIVPTTKMRTGDLSEYAAAKNISIRDPLTGQPFLNNQIPNNRISPIAKNILGFIPTPNYGAPGALIQNYQTIGHREIPARWYHLRLDHRVTQGNVVTFSWYRFTSNDHWDTMVAYGGTPFDGGSTGASRSQAWSIQDTQVISTRSVNELSLAYNHQQTKRVSGNQSGKAYLQSVMGITDVGGRQLNDSIGIPQVTLQTLGGFGQTVGNLLGSAFVGTNGYDEVQTVTLRDNFSHQVGGHLVKAGMELRRSFPNSQVIGYPSWGSFTFTGGFSGYDYADFLLGLPYTTAISIPRNTIKGRQGEVGFFVQDTWKVNSRLTITPGLRFQHYGTPWDASGQYYNFDLASLKVVVPDEKALAAVSPVYPKTIPIVTAAQAGYPARLMNFKSILMEPRLGIAWRPRGEKLVVRAAYGIYHVPFIAPGGANSDTTYPATGMANDLLPFSSSGPFLNSESFGPNQIVNGVPSFTFAQPFPSGGGKVSLQTVASVPVDLRAKQWPYDQQWNLTVERELPQRIALRASYVGSKGTQWPNLLNLQQPPPSTIPFTPGRRPYGASPYGTIYLAQLGGNSTYHGLELETTRQFSSGLYLRGWYEWRKSLSDVNGGAFGSAYGLCGRNADCAQDPYNRAAEKGWATTGFVPHNVRVVASYDLPVGRGKRFASNLPGILNHVIGNWSGTPIITWSTKARYTAFYTTRDTANVGVAGGRADIICDGNSYGSTPGLMWNPACYGAPPNGRFGNASRGALYGPATWTTGLNVFKTFYLTGKETGPYFKLEGYISNLLNHSNSSSPASTNIASASFGRFLVSAGDVRSMYFRFRIGW